MYRIIILSYFILLKGIVWGCCGEKDYRLFPIGEMNNQIVFIEFDLFRNCKMGSGAGENNEFWIKGTVKLMQSKGDSLSLIQIIDTLNYKECTCTYKNYYANTKYENLISGNYEKALKIAQQKNGFSPLQPKNIVFNDSLNTQLVQESTDSSFYSSLIYKDVYTVNLAIEQVTSCYPNKVAEARVYTSANYQITILRLRCNFLKQDEISNHKERFKNIETAVCKEQAQWHGIAKDYWFITKRKNK